MILGDILTRVEERLKATKQSADAASKAAEKPDAIRNMRRAVRKGEEQKVQIATLNALAPVLQTSASWLMTGVGSPGPKDVGSSSTPVSPVLQSMKRLVRPLYGGVVDAGSFRPVDAFNDFDRDLDAAENQLPQEEAHSQFPDVPLVSFKVAGDSMNALEPSPILPGQRVIGVDFEGLRNRVDLRDGMVVVVEQTLDGGHLRERSVKQIKLFRDRTEFCPRSTNKAHKPIVVPHDMQEQGAEDGREVRILALVLRVVTDMPEW